MNKKQIEETISGLKEIRADLVKKVEKEVEDLSKIEFNKDINTLIEKLRLLDSRWKQ